jgi:hypothetical protein
LEKLLKVGIIFPIKYSEWVSNLVPVRKATDYIKFFVDFHALNQAIMTDHFPLPNMEIILQQVAGSQMMLLLNDFSGDNQMRIKGEDTYKTIFITHWGILTYEHMPSVLSDVSTSFKIPM